MKNHALLLSNGTPNKQQVSVAIKMHGVVRQTFLLQMSIAVTASQWADPVPADHPAPVPHNFQGQLLVAILEEFWSRPTPEFGTRSALTVNGTEFYALGPGQAPFWDFADMLNFTLRVIVSSRTVPQQIKEGRNNSAEGEGGLLVSGLANITHGYSIYPYIAGLRDLQYLHVVRTQWHYVFFRQPSVLRYRSIYLDPFSSTLWVVLLVTWATLVLIVCGLSTLLGQQPEGDTMETGISGPLSDAAIWMISMATGRSSHHGSSSTMATRVVEFTASVLGFVVMVFYTALLISTLALQINPITDFADLLDFGYQAVGFPGYPDPRDFTTDSAVGERMFNQTRTNWLSYADTPAKVFDNNRHFAGFEVMHGFWMNARPQNYTSQEICSLSNFRSMFPAKQAMIVRKGSVLKEVFNRKILRIIESGINRRHDAHFVMTTVDQCPEPERYSNDSINIVDTAEAFYVFGFGLVIGFVVLVIEKLCKFYYK